MKITITDFSKQPDLTYVAFKCEYGNGKGVWYDEQIASGVTTYVEFDIEEFETASKCLAEKIYKISATDEVVTLTGEVADVQDEILFFRFGGTIIQIEYGSHFFEIKEWITLTVKVESLSIHPINI